MANKKREGAQGAPGSRGTRGYLVLSRQAGEAIQIGEGESSVHITVRNVGDRYCSLLIDAPRSTRVVRTELLSDPPSRGVRWDHVLASEAAAEARVEWTEACAPHSGWGVVHG
jgi:carbon storage regulator CsrA